MKFHDYGIVLVTPKQGATASQLALVRHKLGQIAAMVEDGYSIRVLVPTYSWHDAENSVDAAVRNLRTKDKVVIEYMPLHRRLGCAADIVRERAESGAWDEVWCCVPASPTHSSRERATFVYTRGIIGAMGRIYKLIPPWAENPERPVNEPKRKKKGARLW